VSTGGAVDDDLDPLQRASPIGIWTDITDSAHRFRASLTNDPDDGMTWPRKVG
jgi:hypothetical protein